MHGACMTLLGMRGSGAGISTTRQSMAHIGCFAAEAGAIRLMDAELLAVARATPPTALMTLVLGWLSPFVTARLCVVESQNFRGRNTWPVL